MESYWKWLADVWNESLSEDKIYKIITFDSSAKVEITKKLD